MQQKLVKTPSALISQMLASSSSHFQRKNQQMIIKYVTKQLNLQEDVAWLLVNAHSCTTTTQIMNLFLYNDDDLLEHYYIGPNVILMQKSPECKIQQDPHSITNMYNQQQKYQSQYLQKHSQQYISLINENTNQVPNMCRVCGQSFKRHINFIQNEDIQQLREIYKYHQETAKIIRSHISESFQQEKQHSRRSSYILDPLLETMGEKIDYLDYQYKDQYQQEQQQYATFQCQICSEKSPKSMMVIFDEVQHYICVHCMTTYLGEEIMNLRVENISCPHCGKVLSFNTIKGYVSNIVFEKYKTFIKNVQIDKNPNLKWCPNPKCSVVINLKQKRKKRIKCPKCGIQICGKCNREYHPKQSCDAVIRSQLKGLENANDIQKCKKCKALVEKISGCNHMTCSVCRYQWCWLCGSTYSPQHFSAFNPFGCAGMQDRNYHNYGKCKIYIIRLLMLLGFIIFLPILIPISMVLCGPVIAIISYNKRFRRRGCFIKFVSYILLIPFGIMLNPFIWIWAFFYFTSKLIHFSCQWFRERRRIHESSDDYLKRRFIQQDNEIVQ